MLPILHLLHRLLETDHLAVFLVRKKERQKDSKKERGPIWRMQDDE